MDLPSLSLTDTDVARLAEALGASLAAYGFAVVTDHGIDADLVENARDQARRFFALSDARKRRYIVPAGAGQRGYTSLGVETAKGADRPDRKEFWHVGRDGPPGSGTAGPTPIELPAFTPTMRRLFEAFDRAGRRVLAGIARHLGLPDDGFEDCVEGGESILRLLHYPPVPANALDVRAAPHEDIDLVTLLLGAEEAGLELLTRNGRWLAVDPPPGALVVNVGDMLERISNRRLPSTTHRVVDPPPADRGRSRYAMPFFVHPRPEVILAPLSQCVDDMHPPSDPPISAADFLADRLAAIGLAPA